MTAVGSLLVTVGLFGSALLYGDGIITPAISVLGAVEGISVATPALHHLVVPVAFVVILGLYALQRRGTAGVGALSDRLRAPGSWPSRSWECME